MNRHRFALPFVSAIAIVLAGSIFSSRATSVTFEAEAGTLGADFAVSNSSSPAYHHPV
jgi:hypothetical protein